MYLHVEDHSQFAWMLKKKGILGCRQLFKIYASADDPRETFEKSTLAVIEISGKPLSAYVFDFKTRGEVSGRKIEEHFAENNFTELAKQTARALLRFASDEKTQFLQHAMEVKLSGKWVIEHPLQIIDRLERAGKPGQEQTIHLDIFSPKSLERLGKIVDLHNPASLLTPRERIRMEREMRGSMNKER